LGLLVGRGAEAARGEAVAAGIVVDGVPESLAMACWLALARSGCVGGGVQPGRGIATPGVTVGNRPS
jgi:hypothetical protein